MFSASSSFSSSPYPTHPYTTSFTMYHAFFADVLHACSVAVKSCSAQDVY